MGTAVWVSQRYGNMLVLIYVNIQIFTCIKCDFRSYLKKKTIKYETKETPGVFVDRLNVLFTLI